MDNRFVCAVCNKICKSATPLPKCDHTETLICKSCDTKLKALMGDSNDAS